MAASSQDAPPLARRSVAKAALVFRSRKAGSPPVTAGVRYRHRIAAQRFPALPD
jgi:hypothetical protein